MVSGQIALKDRLSVRFLPNSSVLFEKSEQMLRL